MGGGLLVWIEIRPHHTLKISNTQRQNVHLTQSPSSAEKRKGTHRRAAGELRPGVMEMQALHSGSVCLPPVTLTQKSRTYHPILCLWSQQMATNKHPQTLSKRPDFLEDSRRGRMNDATKELKHVGNALLSDWTWATDSSPSPNCIYEFLIQRNKRKKSRRTGHCGIGVTGKAKKQQNLELKLNMGCL